MPGADEGAITWVTSFPRETSLADASFTHREPWSPVRAQDGHPRLRMVSDGYVAALVENAVARAYKDGYDKGLSDAHDLQVSLGDSPF